MSSTLGTFNNGFSSVVAGTNSTTPLTINSTAGIQFCNSNGTQLNSLCNISSTGVFNCSGLTITGPLTCSSLIIPNNGTITCLGNLNCNNTAITGVSSLDCNSINSIKVNNRPFQWIMTFIICLYNFIPSTIRILSHVVEQWR